ncbi:MAG: heme o synthase [Pseudomonadota bacterium]
MSETAAPLSLAPEPEFNDYVALMKPRVMRLVVFTALAGLVAAPVAVHPVIAVAAILCIAVGAGASGALNMWWDADIDAVMGRTTGRPIPAGRIAPGEALAVGLGLSGLSVMLLFLFTTPLAAGLLAFTIFFYAVIYTMWLKRATPQNIVIGGAAGAFPPMIGWAVATGGIALEPVLMFALIFLWTPPHFWALALARNEDYAAARVPMLPVVAGERVTRRHILVYSVLTAVAALALAVTSVGGPVYGAVALLLNAEFLRRAWGLWGRQAPADFGAEWRFFAFSIFYLFAHFAALLIEAGLRGAQWAWQGWPIWL